MSNEEVQAISNNEQSACDSTMPPFSNGIRAKKFTKKPTFINQRKTSKCSVCKKTIRHDNVKHLKHSGVLNSNQVKKVIWRTRCRKDYHKSVSCIVCKKTMRSDYLNKHMTARHNSVLNAAEHQMKPSDAYVNKPAKNVTMIYKSYDRKVTNATSCGLTTVASALHWVFTHVHDDTVTFLECNRERDASERITNLLEPIEEQLANMLDQKFNRVANVLILRPSDAESTTI